MSSTAIDPVFEQIKDEYGFVPNILRELGYNSPAVLKLYLSGNQAMAKSSLSEKESHMIDLALSTANECDYCTSAHAAFLKGLGAAESDIRALKKGSLPSEPKLRNLISAARLIFEMKGHLTGRDIERLQKLGIDKTKLYEIIGLIALKTVTTYVNHISHIPIDPQFGP